MLIALGRFNRAGLEGGGGATAARPARDEPPSEGATTRRCTR